MRYLCFIMCFIFLSQRERRNFIFGPLLLQLMAKGAVIRESVSGIRYLVDIAQLKHHRTMRIAFLFGKAPFKIGRNRAHLISPCIKYAGLQVRWQDKYL